MDLRSKPSMASRSLRSARDKCRNLTNIRKPTLERARIRRIILLSTELFRFVTECSSFSVGALEMDINVYLTLIRTNFTDVFTFLFYNLL
jgi:hypothetical protein